jgi:hypothetical protein
LAPSLLYDTVAERVEGITMAWDPQAVKDALDLEMHPIQDEPSKSYTDVAESMLEENLPAAVQSLVWMSLWSENESYRYKASVYIIDRVLGRTTDKPLKVEDSEDVLKKLLAGVVN